MLQQANLPIPAVRANRLRVIHRRESAISIKIKAEGIKMQVTPVFTALQQAYESKKYTVAVLEGGSRSSKTHSIIQFLIKYAQDNEFTDKRILIARQKSTWTAATVLFDFLGILKKMGLYEFCYYNKTSKILTIYKTEVC